MMNNRHKVGNKTIKELFELYIEFESQYCIYFFKFRFYKTKKNNIYSIFLQ